MKRESSSTQIQIPAGTTLTRDGTTSSCSPPWLFPEYVRFSHVKMSLDWLIFWQLAQGMVICIWMDLLHTCSPESRYPHLSQYISDREGRNHPFQKNWARAKGECWSNVVGISYRVRKKIILKAYKIPGAVISAAGSTYVFGMTPCLCQSWSSVRKTSEYFTPTSS